MEKGFWVLLVLLLSFAYAQDSKQFIYTSLKFNDCADLSRNEAEDYGIQECPSIGGYRLYYAYGDARSWLELETNGARYSFAPWDLGDAIKGFFPYVNGELVEWRYTISGTPEALRLEPYALIYRMNYQDSDDETKTIDLLVVLRLEENNVCYLGNTKTNEEARILADGNDGCNR